MRSMLSWAVQRSFATLAGLWAILVLGGCKGATPSDAENMVASVAGRNTAASPSQASAPAGPFARVQWPGTGDVVDVVSGGFIPEDRLSELRRRSVAKDSAAQYELAMIGSVSDSEALLNRAVAAGYPPALIEAARRAAEKGVAGGLYAQGLLEEASARGYYPAIQELARCLYEADCGPRSPESALEWTIVGLTLFRTKQVDASGPRRFALARLNAAETSLRREVSNEVQRSAEVKAAVTAAKIGTVSLVPPRAWRGK